MTKPHRRPRWAVASSRITHRILRGLWAIEGGFWLGVMDADDLAAATRHFYETSERWTSEYLTFERLSTWESSAVAEWFPPSGRVLVAAAGSGREVLPLADMGYDVIGFDPSTTLIERGNRLLAGTRAADSLVVAPPNQIPAALEGPFDAAIVGWGGISHIQGHDNRVAFLSEIRGLLGQDAPLLISFLLRSDDGPAHTITRSVATALRRLRRDRTPVELGDSVHGSFDHYFTPDEMASELAAAGFAERSRKTRPYAHIVAAATS